jgi:hypothetical protein
MEVLTAKLILFGICLNSGIPHSTDLLPGQDRKVMNSEIRFEAPKEPIVVV